MKSSNWVLAPLLAALMGCTINPVTGNRELALVSADQEIAIGEQQYAPSRQMQGGDVRARPAAHDVRPRRRPKARRRQRPRNCRTSSSC